jgi:arylsulfatase A-like enzyme
MRDLNLQMKAMSGVLLVWTLSCSLGWTVAADRPPHIIFVMADDMGWGQTGYRQHPILKTPELDAMAASGLRLERFYAGCPVCSPTRASVLTGRSNDRSGVRSHGYALRLQEKTIAQALSQAGYVTGHFGKWHLNGFKGPGAPILPGDPRSPSAFGFAEWLSVTNFFDLNPLMSERGQLRDLQGDSSEVTIAAAVGFLEKHHRGDQPMFAVIWYGNPHSPYRSLPEDRAPFADLSQASANHYGELVALDRSLGTLRQSLRRLGIAENTLLVFCSDNGGLPDIKPDTVGGLRGFKGSVYEGGLRVPGLIEWPAVIAAGRISDYPACTMDLFPTVVDLLDLPSQVLVQPVDGISLQPLLRGEPEPRTKPIPFRYGSKLAWIDGRYKLLTSDLSQGRFELFDLERDPHEQHDLSQSQPELFQRLHRDLLAWNESVEASVAGKDYAEGKLTQPDPPSLAWYETEAYAPLLDQMKDRREFQSYLERSAEPKKKGKKRQPR